MKQITSRIDEDLHKLIKSLADVKNWPFDYTVYVLLQQAMKEKLRKKKSVKENNT